jgi:hypothetical protein
VGGTTMTTRRFEKEQVKFSVARIPAVALQARKTQLQNDDFIFFRAFFVKKNVKNQKLPPRSTSETYQLQRRNVDTVKFCRDTLDHPLLIFINDY